MNNTAFNRRSLRLPAALLLAGQLLYVIVTLFHTGGEANDHHAIFAAYADSSIWTAVHATQFFCMAIFLAGLVALFDALDVETGLPRVMSRLGIAATTAALALCGGVLAVDGVALKQAVNAWATAPEAEKATRFASAETMRWLEWGTRSYENFTIALAVLLAAAVVLRAKISRPIAFAIGLAGITYVVQGWTAGGEGFSSPDTIAIVLSEVLNAVWMIWLLVAAWRSPASNPASVEVV